jgi:hypothetical protein
MAGAYELKSPQMVHLQNMYLFYQQEEIKVKNNFKLSFFK